jgi:biopolymer transport protein ExbD
VTEELSDRIKLPLASQAKPLTAADTNFMYLNVDKDGKIIVPVGEPKVSDAEIRTYLRQAAHNHPLGEKEALDKVTVIIRADRDARFVSIHRTMLAIKAIGFKKLQLRAEIAGSS